LNISVSLLFNTQNYELVLRTECHNVMSAMGALKMQEWKMRE